MRSIVSREVGGQAPVLTGPVSLTQRRQIECIGAAIGRPIRVETISEEEARFSLSKIIPAEYANLLVSQWRDEAGVPAVITDTVERITGRAT